MIGTRDTRICQALLLLLLMPYSPVRAQLWHHTPFHGRLSIDDDFTVSHPAGLHKNTIISEAVVAQFRKFSSETFTGVEPACLHSLRLVRTGSMCTFEVATFTVTVLTSPPFWAAWWFWITLFAALAAVSMLLLRRTFESLRREVRAQKQFSQALIESQEKERRKIAAVLRDSIGRSLIIIRNRAVRSMESQNPGEREHLGEISSLAGEAIITVRGIAHDLRPHQLDRLGLTKALRSIVFRQSGSSGISLTADLDTIDGILAPEHEINLYRIFQESINNIIQHSGATRAHIIVRRDPTIIHVTIQDNGRGLPADKIHPARSGRRPLGLTRMMERAQLMGGMLTVDSPGSSGTIVTLTLPI
jgi:signal transduction histidine kinase